MSDTKPQTCRARMTTHSRGGYVSCYLLRGRSGWHATTIRRGAKRLRVAWIEATPPERGPEPRP